VRALAAMVLGASLMLVPGSAASTAPSAIGTAYYSGGPHRMQVAQEGVPGLAIVALRGARVVRRTVTGARGGFALLLPPGAYLLKLESGTPSHTCGAAPIKVAAHQTRHLKLYCNIS
jgi:hypothetical protein